MIVEERAPAKINLALHVRARRADGYHDLETLFAFATDGDVVRVEPAATDSFVVDGPFACALVEGERSDGETDRDGAGRSTPASNLVLRARDAFRTVAATPPVVITLTKMLPVASGIGGGSADAAATLRALARVVGIAPADPRLVAVAAGLGADVPACLLGRTSLGTGRGDMLQPLDGLAGTPLLLINPGVAVSTARVFAGWDRIDRGPLPAGDLLARALAARNDLEAPATAAAPVIAEVRALLDAAPGTILSRMSGSGATCFALFDDDAARDAAAGRAAMRGWWTLPTRMA